MTNAGRLSSSSTSTVAKTRTKPSNASVRVRQSQPPVIDSHVKVAVRCRPISAKETKDGHQSIVEFEHGQRVIVNNVGESPSDQLGTRSGERNNLAQVYEFDAVFDWTSSQETVYNSVCRPIVDSVLEGYNGTIFAYGQTGTGKTYTMEGSATRRPSSRRSSDSKAVSTRQAADSALSQTTDTTVVGASTSSAGSKKETTKKSDHQIGGNESRGVIPRAFEHIFDHIAERKDVQFLVRTSYMEIYQEKIHDLLRKDRSQHQEQQKLKLHERPDTGVYVKDLTTYVCKSIEEIERVMRVGNQNRKVGATDMNEHSSRSHAVFIITIEQQQLRRQQQQTTREASAINVNQQQSSTTRNNKQQDVSDSRALIRVGRLNLVDLAGSERQRKTNNSGQRHKESIKINLSLSALGNVINTLMKINEQQQQQSSKTTGASLTLAPASSGDTFHVPYRDSKLTRLLQDSLGGNSRTLMIANIGPASYNYDETINTLNYASRAKCIQNRPRLNEDPKDALLRQLQDEIEELRSKLASMAAKQQPAANVRINHDTTIEPSRSGEQRASKKVEQELIELREKLVSLESKLLNGVDSSHLGDGLDQRLLEGYTRRQASELEKNRAQLIDQASREERIRTELERREEAELEIHQSYSSVQQEVDAKRALIRQILLKTKEFREDLETTQNTYRLELDELDQLQYVLQKELRLKCLIMDNFIPNHHVDQLLPRISYDDKRDSCLVEPIELPLDCCNLDSSIPSTVQYADIWQPDENSIRPRSELERISETINPNDARYKYENVLNLQVEQPSFGEPSRKCAHLKQQQPSSRIQTLIEDALNKHEPDIVIE